MLAGKDQHRSQLTPLRAKLGEGRWRRSNSASTTFSKPTSNHRPVDEVETMGGGKSAGNGDPSSCPPPFGWTAEPRDATPFQVPPSTVNRLKILGDEHRRWN